MRSLDLAYSIRKPSVEPTVVDQCDERFLGEHRSLGEVWCCPENRLQLLRGVCRQVFDCRSRACELVLRMGKKRGRTERMKAQAEHADPAGRVQYELTRQLSGEEQPRLDGPDAAGLRHVYALE